MIARIHGTVEELMEDRALVDLGGGLVYEVLLPAFVVPRLQSAAGQARSFHTLHFLESMSQGATFIPRLAGFPSGEDKDFFELLVSVKGLGYRRGLRAMTMAPAQIAAAIAERDLKLLQTMPTVGKRNAETLTMELKDKVDRFLTSGQAVRASAEAPGESNQPSPSNVRTGRAREALEALVALGENHADAARMVDRVLTANDPPADSQGVIEAVYRMKAGGS